jgi:hypothetical protein
VCRSDNRDRDPAFEGAFGRWSDVDVAGHVLAVGLAAKVGQLPRGPRCPRLRAVPTRWPSPKEGWKYAVGGRILESSDVPSSVFRQARSPTVSRCGGRVRARLGGRRPGAQAAVPKPELDGLNEPEGSEAAPLFPFNYLALAQNRIDSPPSNRPAPSRVPPSSNCAWLVMVDFRAVPRTGPGLRR